MKTTKKRRLLDEATAWRVLAVMFGHRSGLCFAVDRLRNAKLVNDATVDRMARRLGREGKKHTVYMNETSRPYYWPRMHVDANNVAVCLQDNNRVAFALAAAKRAAK